MLLIHSRVHGCVVDFDYVTQLHAQTPTLPLSSSFASEAIIVIIFELLPVNCALKFGI